MHKQGHLGKRSQGKSRARSCSKPAMGKRARERQGTSGASEAQEQRARTEPKGPRGALTRGCAQCYGGEEATPGGHPGRPPWESRKRPPPACGARGPPWWSRSSRHLAKTAQRSPGKGPCSVLQRKAKNPRGHLLAHRGGKKAFLPAAAGHERPPSWCMSSRQ